MKADVGNPDNRYRSKTKQPLVQYVNYTVIGINYAIDAKRSVSLVMLKEPLIELQI